MHLSIGPSLGTSLVRTQRDFKSNESTLYCCDITGPFSNTVHSSNPMLANTKRESHETSSTITKVLQSNGQEIVPLTAVSCVHGTVIINLQLGYCIHIVITG